MSKKKTKIIKWAQLSPIERAYQKAKKADRCYSVLYRNRKLETKKDKQERNRYYQLLGHWCKLKKESEALSSPREN